MSRLERREACSAVCKAAVITALVVASLWVLHNLQDPASMSQEGWHYLGTGMSGAMMHPYPKVHKVVVQPLEKSTAEVLLGYIAGGTTVEGEYDPNTGTIRIVGDLSRLQAGLPGPLQPTFRHTLRHEYGHAFLEDYCRAKGMDPMSPSFLACAQPGSHLDPKDFPRKLRPVLAAYRSASSDIYGMDYFTSTFEEFFAESYARYVAGDSIPGGVRSFFAGDVERVKNADLP